ncbi:MAG: gliding motility-associated C-terminal domain-containing protein [Bacteroidota bacterium]
MEKYAATFIFLSFMLVNTIAQDEKRANVWYFNPGLGLDFNTTPPTVLTDGKIMSGAGEGGATICDRNGQLLIYTDGKRIWNRNHEVIPGAADIGGHISVTQSSIILPSPADDNILYVFAINELKADSLHLNGEFYYSIVDMRLNGSLGGIVSVKNKLYDYCTEKLTAIRHCNQKDFWIITHENGNDNFLIWKLTAEGISDEPIIRKIGTNHFVGVGSLKSSPLGDKIAISNFIEDFVEVFDFDTENGRITQPISLRGGTFKTPYSLAFSPNGKRLYVSNFLDSLIMQYNLTLATDRAVNDSRIDVAKLQVGFSNPGVIQNAPDGKIYISVKISPYIAAIRQPNLLGEACDVHQQEVFLGDKRSGITLPNFLPIYFRQRDTIEAIEWTENCEQEKELTAVVSIGGDSLAYEWYFENELLPHSNATTIQVENDGNYTFKALIFDRCKTVLRELVASAEVQFDDVPLLEIVAIEQQEATCDEANGELNIQASGGEPPYDFSINERAIQTNATFSNLRAGEKMISVRDARGCEVYDTTTIQQFSRPKVVNWQSQPSLCGEATGTLVVSVGDGFGDISIAWQNDFFTPELTQSNLAQGDYLVQIKDESNCQIDTLLTVNSLRCPIYIPNAISPNDDGINDVFQLYPHPEFDGEIISFMIVDKWGGLIYREATPESDMIIWEGYFKGQKVVNGEYLYVLDVRYVDGVSERFRGTVWVEY